MNTNLNVIRERGFAALTKELGAATAVRFIRQVEIGRGDYTAERDELLRDVTLEDIVNSINERAEKKG